MPPRLFVTVDPDDPGRARLDPAAVRHLRALRLGRGDRFVAIVGPRREQIAEVEGIASGGATCRLGEQLPDRGADPAAPRVLAVGLGDLARLDLIVEKATELGATAIHPFRAARSQVASAAASRLERWRRIARSACEQCGRTVPPAIEARTLPDLCREPSEPGRPGGLRMLLLSAAGPPLREVVAAAARVPDTAVALVVGPEGGLTAEEERFLVDRGALRAGLGPRTLRFETAAIAALAAIAACLPDPPPPGIGRGHL